MHSCFEPGRLVVSTSGRDRGMYYLVLIGAEGNSVYVVDGKLRKVAKPKRKNEKHLRVCMQIASEINAKIRAGLKVTDLEIRRALKEFIPTVLN